MRDDGFQSLLEAMQHRRIHAVDARMKVPIISKQHAILTATTDAWEQAIAMVEEALPDFAHGGKIATGGTQKELDLKPGGINYSTRPPCMPLLGFDALVQRRIDKITSTLVKKAKEYASDTDRFHNFRVGARIENTTPEKALKGMMLKHEVSVRDLIRWADESPEKLTQKLIDAKIGDNINYLILLEGLLKERMAELCTK